jgi:hypothetical protein
VRGVVMHAPRDFRVQEREDPKIQRPTDAVIRVSATCVCGSDLWPYRGAEPIEDPSPDRPRVRRRRGGGRQRSQYRQAWPVRGRRLLRVGQHVRELPRRLPDLLRPARVDERDGRSGAAAACPTGRRHGGPAPVRRYLPELIDLIWNRRIDPGKVFDLTLPLEKATEAYRAMDERRAIKALS